MLNGEKYPLISWAHGWTNGDERISVTDGILNNLASSGYVIVGNKSGGLEAYCDESPD